MYQDSTGSAAAEAPTTNRDATTATDNGASDPRSRIAVAARGLYRHGEPVSARHRWPHTGKTLHRNLERRFDAAVDALAAADGDSSASLQWLQDNDHIVREALSQLDRQLPGAFLRHWPNLTVDGRVEPRIVVLVEELLAVARFPLAVEQAETFLRAYQAKYPLTIGELWAFPALLRAAVLRLLCDSAEAEAAGRPLTVSGAECIVSLRMAAVTDWADFFERVNPIDPLLNRDPAAAYAAMDFQTRDRYRQAVERLARRTGTDDRQV
ncbi:MAG: hypothetical protein AAFX58_15190, partial [Pseudomonadota bacterium]